MTLKDELTEIQGVGDATAEKIMAVVESHNPQDTDTLEKAIYFLENKNPKAAQSVLESALNG